jgi:hypothetical protein
MLVDRHEVSPILIVADDDVGQADEHSRLFVKSVRNAIAHRRHEYVTYVGAIYRPNANPNPSAFGYQGVLLHCGRQLTFTTKELLALAQLFVLVLAHFFPALFQHARHAIDLPGAGV